MIKGYKFLLILIMFSGLIAGCEDEDRTCIEGSWQAYKVVFLDLSGNQSEYALPESWLETLSLNPDGTFTFESKQKNRPTSGAGSWEGTSTNLIFSQRGQDQIEYRISGDNLILSDGIPEGKFNLYWEKIN